MTATSRTDIHRPSAPEFDPADYCCYGVFYLGTSPGQMALHQDLNDRSRHRAAIEALESRGMTRGGVYGSRRCSHCGTSLAYAALMLHTPTNTYLHIGEDCLDNRFELDTKAEFQALRKAQELNREQMRKADRIAALVAEHPALAALIDDAIASTYGAFTASVGWKFRKDGRLSPNQITAVERVVAGAIERAYNEAHRMTAQMIEREQAAPAPSGRVTVTGEVVHTKWQDNDFGGGIKMLVVASSGYKMWVTAPDTLFMDNNLERGTWVQFDAKLTPKEDDPTFAWGSRPTKAKRIEAPTFA